MHHRKRMLLPDDQKAIDVILDHAANTRSRMTRVTSAAAPSRINAATKILSLLNELPAIDPPKNLVAKTLARIDYETGNHVAHHTPTSSSVGTHFH